MDQSSREKAQNVFNSLVDEPLVQKHLEKLIRRAARKCAKEAERAVLESFGLEEKP